MNQSEIIPASPTEAKSALRALFESFPTTERGEAAGAVGTYLIAIEGYSLKAIHMAVKRLIRGEVEGLDARFLPTPAQVSKACRYCENLLAPPAPRKALPSPGDIEPTEASKIRVAELARTWSRAVPDPSEQFDEWDQSPSPLQTGRAA